VRLAFVVLVAALLAVASQTKTQPVTFDLDSHCSGCAHNCC